MEVQVTYDFRNIQDLLPLLKIVDDMTPCPQAKITE